MHVLKLRNKLVPKKSGKISIAKLCTDSRNGLSFSYSSDIIFFSRIIANYLSKSYTTSIQINSRQVPESTQTFACKHIETSLILCIDRKSNQPDWFSNDTGEPGQL